MTALNISLVPEQFLEGTQRILSRYGCCLSHVGIPVTVAIGSELSVHISSEGATILCPLACYFRALGLLLEHIQEKDFYACESPKFAHLGVQLDVSRNGALRTEAIKAWIEDLALMGYNQLYLYMEDVFFIPGRKYFGYMRGRYTAAELKELDDWAYGYGLELIPSIQTLGHHRQYLRWEESADVRDTPEELLADSDATYAFIEDMIRAVTKPLRSKKIVLGLDETHTLGLGAHLQRFGYEQPYQIFCRHLERIFAITDSMGLEGIISSDMFFRMCDPTHDYYKKGTVISAEIANNIPSNATLLYWHYGEAPGCDAHMLEKHMALGRKTIFYGGTWTWSGHLPNTHYAINATKEALCACAAAGIDSIVQTLWFDDGNECHFLYGYLTLQYTAEYAFGHTEDAHLAKRFHFCTGADAEAFMDMSAYQYIFQQKAQFSDFKELFRGKTLFWQDILLGQADEFLQNNPFSDHYFAYADRFKVYAAQNPRWKKNYTFIENLFRYLGLKCRIAEQLTRAYLREDQACLHQICNVWLPELLELTEQCHAMHKSLWLESYKPFGWEVLDLRYGGTEARICTAQERLGAYLRGEILCLEELEEPRLPMVVSPWNPFRRILSGSVEV